jgi:hypothetical protein
MPRSVSILPGNYNVELPNGISYSATYATTTAGPTVILTDEEFAKVGAVGAGTGLQDNGNVGTSVVTAQGVAVTAVTAANATDATSAVTLANNTKAVVNALISSLSVAGGALA